MENYVHGHHGSVLQSHRWRTAENSAGYLLPKLRKGLSVLDVGCGPGTITVDLAAAVSPGAVLGMDTVPEIVEQATTLAETRGVDNARFAVGDAYAIDAADNSFDVVHAHQVLQHLERPVEALCEFRRVLRPGGILAVREVDYGGVIGYPASGGLASWNDIYHRVHRAGGGEPDAGRRLKAWVQQAGFNEIQPSASLWLFESDEDRAWWGGSWAVRAVESRFATLAVEYGIADTAELQAIAAAWSEWADAPDGWLLMPHGEVIATV